MQIVQMFTEEDVELLKKQLPDNPCDDCGAHRDGSCCGCDKERDYRQAVQPYKDNNIYDTALDLKRRSFLLKKIAEFQDEIIRIETGLPEEIRRNLWKE